MRGFMVIGVWAGLVSTPAFADNNTCLALAGAWTASGTAKAITVFRGNYAIELTGKVAATPPEVKSALQPAIVGECLVGWGAGESLPDGCKEGSAVTMTGPLSFDDKNVAGIQVGEITCE